MCQPVGMERKDWRTQSSLGRAAHLSTSRYFLLQVGSNVSDVTRIPGTVGCRNKVVFGTSLTIAVIFSPPEASQPCGSYSGAEPRKEFLKDPPACSYSFIFQWSKVVRAYSVFRGENTVTPMSHLSGAWHFCGQQGRLVKKTDKTTGNNCDSVPGSSLPSCIFISWGKISTTPRKKTRKPK